VRDVEAEWLKPAAVPVKVMLTVAAEVLEEAARVTCFEVPGETLSDAGEAVTPEGSPEIETEIEPLKELIAAAETVTSEPEPPA